MPDSESFTIEERVRWGDVDAARIIFYGAYIRFFEIAETELFRAVGLPYGVIFDEIDLWLPRVRSLPLTGGPDRQQVDTTEF